MDRGGRLVGGRYRLVDRVGSGGMGTVWRAEDTLLEREVAVKEVTFPPGTRPEEVEVLSERTRREARHAARLTHPNAVTVFDVVEEDGRPWLVMELVEARTLADAVRDRPLPPARTARIGLGVLGALEAAHRRGILHRDVKPSNVLLAPAQHGQGERAVLTDFGIATSAADSSITSSGLLLGSPAYIAPERASGQPASPASDLWALGATLFTAVEGRPPYDGGDPLLTVTAVVTGQHAPYLLAGPLVPVLDGLLEKDPARRLPADAARRLLEQVAERTDDVTRPADVTWPAAVVGAGAAAAGGPAPRTAALDVADVRREAARSPGGTPEARLPAVARPPSTVRRRAVPLAAGALALLALGGGVLALTDRGDGRTAAASGAAPTPTGPAAPTSAAPATPAPTTPAPTTPAPTTPAPTTPAPSTPAPTTPAPTTPAPTTVAPRPAGGAVPAGWRTYTAGDGWTAALPPSYAARSYRSGAEYVQPGTGRTVRVETGRGQPDPVADRRGQARSFAAKHPDYREIAITPTTYQGLPAADWEFTYAGVHVVDRVVNVGGTGYSLWFQTRQPDAAAARAEFETVAAAFRPAG